VGAQRNDESSKNEFKKCSGNYLYIPPESSDLAPRIFRLFGPLKHHVGDKSFAGDEEVEMEVWKWQKTVERLLFYLLQLTGRTIKEVHQR
jgi:hypothetical protein